MQRVKISDFAEVITGGTPSTSVNEYWDGGTIPWLQSGACQNCIINECDTFITEDGLKNSATKMMQPESVLIALTGATTGKVGYLTFEACANQSVTGIQPNDKFVPKYLYYYLMGIRQKILDDSYGGAQKHISQGYVKNLEVPLGTIEEQRIIVDAIEKVDAVISARKNELQLFDNLIKARFVEMFGDPEYNNKGWQVKKLNDLCNVGSSKRIYQEEQTTDGVPFWRISDLVTKMDTGDVESSLYIPESRYEELKAQGLVPETGDILVTSRGTLGRCYIITPDDRFYFQDGMISWLSNYSDEITPLYIQHLFDMAGLKKQIDGLQAGSTVAYLSIAMLKKLNIMIPNRELQEQFAAFVAQVDKSKLVVQKALDQAQLLFDSLMQKYFG